MKIRAFFFSALAACGDASPIIDSDAGAGDGAASGGDGSTSADGSADAHGGEVGTALDAQTTDVTSDTANVSDSSMCMPIPPRAWSCNGMVVSAPTRFCYVTPSAGADGNVPTPIQCQCAGSYNCACIMAHYTSTCTGVVGCVDAGINRDNPIVSCSN